MRRGSAKVFLQELPCRNIQGNGQGGGGSLAVEELAEVLKVDSDTPRLAPGCVLHTDSAKAYKRVGALRFPENGALQQGELFCDDRFGKHNWTHTAVTHKKKVGSKVSYTLRRWITTKDGKKHDALRDADNRLLLGEPA